MANNERYWVSDLVVMVMLAVGVLVLAWTFLLDVFAFFLTLGIILAFAGYILSKLDESR